MFLESGLGNPLGGGSQGSPQLVHFGVGLQVERGELEVPVTVGQMMFFWAAHRNPTHLLPQCVWG